MIGFPKLEVHREVRRQAGRRPFRIALLALATLVGSAMPVVAQTAESSAPQPTLYQQLGGYDGVHEFVSRVFPRVAQHPQLRHLFQGHGANSQQRQLQLVVELICQRVGGPCAYLGRDMAPVHVGLGISASDWDTFMAIIDHALDEARYAPGVRTRFREIWASFREGVVEP